MTLAGPQGISQDGSFLVGEVQRYRTCIGVVAPVDVEAAGAVPVRDHRQMLARVGREAALDANARQRCGAGAGDRHPWLLMTGPDVRNGSRDPGQGQCAAWFSVLRTARA